MANNHHLHINPTIPRGENRKRRANEIIHSTKNIQNNTLHIFCQGSCPSSPEGIPVSVASCIAWHKGWEAGHLTQIIGQGC